MKRILFISVIALSVVCGAWAQDLTNNPDYKKALEYQKLADDTLAQGDYAASSAYAKAAEEHLAKAKNSLDAQYAKFKANSLIKYLDDRFAKLDRMAAKEQYPDQYAKAAKEYDDAKKRYAAGEYPASIEHSNNALASLDAMGALVASRDGVLPKFYVVRLIPKSRDCFWNIANYSFIYNNPFLWRKIYEANRSKIADANNPRVIEPGQVLEIPSIAGEVREGTYDPKQKYPDFKE